MANSNLIRRNHFFDLKTHLKVERLFLTRLFTSKTSEMRNYSLRWMFGKFQKNDNRFCSFTVFIMFYVAIFLFSLVQFRKKMLKFWSTGGSMCIGYITELLCVEKWLKCQLLNNYISCRKCDQDSQYLGFVSIF